jgi:hypothetical protein
LSFWLLLAAAVVLPMLAAEAARADLDPTYLALLPAVVPLRRQHFMPLRQRLTRLLSVVVVVVKQLDQTAYLQLSHL